MEDLYKKFRGYKGESLSKMGIKSQARAETREDKENANINIADQTSIRSKDAENKKEGISEHKEVGSEAPPKAVVDFTVKTIEQGLMMDYKDNPKVKKVVQPLAAEKAAELENGKDYISYSDKEIVIRAETKNDPEAYRMEARNVTNFLMVQIFFV